MSIDRVPGGNAEAHIPAPVCGAPSASTCNAQLQWRHARLFEARGILADIAHHPDTLVLLACQVICGCGPDPDERTDALGVMRVLTSHQAETANTTPKGGAA